PAQAAGGQDGGAGANEDGLRIAIAQFAAIDADDAAIVARQAQRGNAFDDADGGGLAQLGDDGLHDCPAGAIPFNLDDTISRMGGLAPQLEIAEIVAVEGRTPAGQVLDAGNGLGGNPFGSAMVDNAGP